MAVNHIKNFQDKLKEVERRFKKTGLQKCRCNPFSPYYEGGCKSCQTWDDIEQQVEEEIYIESCNQ